MDPISKLSRALAIIRSAGGTAQRSRAAGKGGNGRAPAAITSDLRSTLAAQFRRVSGPENERNGIRTRIFIEQVLLHEFGDGLRNAQQFQHTVTEVQRVIESDTTLQSELADTLARLALEQPR